MEYRYTEQKFKKMRQAIIAPNLLWILLGSFFISLGQDFQLMPSLAGLAMLGIFFGIVIFFWLRRINKSISKMQDDKLWLTKTSIAMSGEMGASEMPFSTIEKFRLLKYQGLPSIMFKLINGERVILGGFENQSELVAQLKSHLPGKFSTNVFNF